MSDYSDVWNELHEDQTKREYTANECRIRLTDELSTENMITIMFADFIRKQSNVTVMMIADEYLTD